MKYVLQKRLSSHHVISIFLLYLFLFTNLCYSQIKLSFDSIKKNSDGIKLSEFENWSQKKDLVLFFCPISDGITDSLYLKKTEGYTKDIRFKEFQGEFKLIFFKEFDNNSKNPYIINGYKNNDSIINQLQCFILLSKGENLVRAKKKFDDKFDYVKVGNENNLFELKISDFACPKDLPSKMIFYVDFLNEIFNPIYSIEEIVDKLTQRILILESEVNKLNTEILKFNHLEKENNKTEKNKDKENKNKIKEERRKKRSLKSEDKKSD